MYIPESIIIIFVVSINGLIACYFLGRIERKIDVVIDNYLQLSTLLSTYVGKSVDKSPLPPKQNNTVTLPLQSTILKHPTKKEIEKRRNDEVIEAQLKSLQFEPREKGSRSYPM